MKPMSREISGRSPRLHYPVYGEFGFEEPVGKKKYLTRSSPVHQLIFNHQLPTLPLEQHDRIRRQFIQKIKANQLPHFGPYLSNSTSINRSQIYSPEESSSVRNSRNRESISKGIRPERQEGRESRKFQGGNESRLTRNLSMMNDYQKNKRWEQLKVGDSLDRLINPINQTEMKKNKEKQKALDELIKYRYKNPTFLNSHLM